MSSRFMWKEGDVTVLGTPELDDMQDYEDKCYEEHLCIELECGHYDGDMCTLGACLDPPQRNNEE